MPDVSFDLRIQRIAEDAIQRATEAMFGSGVSLRSESSATVPPPPDAPPELSSDPDIATNHQQAVLAVSGAPDGADGVG